MVKKITGLLLSVFIFIGCLNFSTQPVEAKIQK